jgi:hypothetical protein
MDTRDTSVEAYQQAEAEGLLTKERAAVFRVLREAVTSLNGDMTGREVDQVLGSVDAHKRLSELLRQGLAVDAMTRACRVTGRRAIAWRAVLGVYPRPLKGTRNACPQCKSVVTACAHCARCPACGASRAALPVPTDNGPLFSR